MLITGVIIIKCYYYLIYYQTLCFSPAGGTFKLVVSGLRVVGCNIIQFTPVLRLDHLSSSHLLEVN